MQPWNKIGFWVEFHLGPWESFLYLLHCYWTFLVWGEMLIIRWGLRGPTKRSVRPSQLETRTPLLLARRSSRRGAVMKIAVWVWGCWNRDGRVAVTAWPAKRAPTHLDFPSRTRWARPRNNSKRSSVSTSSSSYRTYMVPQRRKIYPSLWLYHLTDFDQVWCLGL